VRGWLRGIVFGIIVVMLTVAISVWQGWIPLPNGQDNTIKSQRALEDTITTTTGSPTLTSSPQEISYKVEYRWDGSILIVTIEGPPRELTFVMSDPDGETVYKEDIKKEDMLDEKENVGISLKRIPPKHGEFTLVLYAPQEDEIIYKKSIVFWEKINATINKVEGKIEVAENYYEIKGFRAEVWSTHEGESPLTVACMVYELGTYEDNFEYEVKSRDTVIAYLRKNTVETIERDFPMWLIVDKGLMSPGKEYESSIVIKVEIYDCSTEELLDSESIVYAI